MVAGPAARLLCAAMSIVPDPAARLEAEALALALASDEWRRRRAAAPPTLSSPAIVSPVIRASGGEGVTGGARGTR